MSELKTHPDWYRQYASVLAKIRKGTTVALLGPRGTGKTQAAVEVIRRVCADSTPEKPRSTLYTTAAEIFQFIRSSYGPERRITEQVAISRFITPGLLVIDELQEAKGSDFEKQMLTLIMDKRYGFMRGTIFIANLEPKAFFANVGSSIQDRMDEGGGHLVFKWQSFRTQTSG